MLFNSIEYIFLFLPIVVIIYFLLLQKHLVVASKIWLIISSICFYGWYDPKYTFLLIFSMLINFTIGNSFHRKIFQSFTKRKILLWVGLIFNILLLGYYKYANFFVDNINYIFKSDIHIAKIILPLGISFFTFTQIAYLVDEYKKEASEYNIVNYMLFVTFFPHLIAGPILHHKEIIPQFSELSRKILNYKNLSFGISLFIIGLFKKVIIADSLSEYVNIGYNINTQLSMLESWIVMLSYTLQIYFDFSGYTDMALGSAKMLNIDLPKNFNSPYKAVSIQDFWRRWHITLSRFLKDYIYIPLGGNRQGERRTYFNLITTMLIGGLWHGASWMFVLWGGVHGLALSINRFYSRHFKEPKKWISILVTFIFLNITWVIFRAENFTQVKRIIFNLFNFQNFVIPKTFGLTFEFNDINNYNNILVVLPIALLVVFCLPNSNQIVEKLKFKNIKTSIILAIVFYMLFISIILKMAIMPYSEFIYFNF